MRRRGQREIKLRRGAVWITGTGHRKDARGVMLAGVIDAVIRKLAFDVLAGAAHTGAVRVAALDDETRYIPVERQSVVEAAFGKLDEVCGREGRVVLSELGDDGAFGRVEGCGAGHDGVFSSFCDWG